MTPILIKGAIYKCARGIYYEYMGIDVVAVHTGLHMIFRELLQAGLVYVPCTAEGLERVERGQIS